MTTILKKSLAEKLNVQAKIVTISLRIEIIFRMVKISKIYIGGSL